MSTGADSEFKYDSLRTSSTIRLLERLEPTSDGTLRFNLFSYDPEQDDLCPYYCLSYTWNNPFAHGPQFRQKFDTVDPQYSQESSIPVLINDRVFLLRRNLHDALRVLPDDTFQEWVNTPLIDANGRTLLHLAAGRGQVEQIQIWLECGADINKVDDEGHNALHYAAGNGRAESVPVLLRYGCQIMKDYKGETPLDTALRLGYGDVAAELQEEPKIQNIFRSIGKIYMWADAICINQKDVEEKNAQVTMMHQIYASASYVVAWLGVSDEETALAIKTLATLKTHLKAFQDSLIEPFGSKDRDKYIQAGVPHISVDQWDSLAALYQRQWFRRAWIVQEALLPPSVLMYIGDQIIQWRDLATVAEAIRYMEAKLGSRFSLTYVPAQDVAVPITWNMAELAQWRRNILRAHQEDDSAKEYQALFSPRKLAYNMITFRASEPRDNVFAYYGLLNLFGEKHEADYSLAIADVYTRAAREVIASEGNLHVLSWCIHAAHRRDDLPSWVPDFGLTGANAIPPSFSADKGLEYTPPCTIDACSPALQIQGAFVGSLSQVSGRSGRGDGEKLRFNDTWLTLPLSLRDQGGPKPVLSCMLWQTLCMGMSTGSMFDAEEYGKEAPDELGLQFRFFLLLLILAAADGKIRERLDLRDNNDKLIFSHIEYDPMQADMEPVLANLDVFEEHDGPGCWLPTRGEVLKYWNEFRYSLLRNTEVAEDNGPTDFYLPEGVTMDNSRAIGTGSVLLSSRAARRCQGFIAAYSTAYGGRQLITCGKSTLGLASVAAQVGDEVWLIPGLNAPAVLRKVSSEDEADTTITRQFLGSCFLWGLMDGNLAAIVGDRVEDLVLV